jgi:outer membrane protein TolC
VLPYLGVELALLQGMVTDKRRYEMLKGQQYKKLLETEGAMVMNELLHDASEGYVEWLRDLALMEVNQRYIETASLRFKALKDLSEIGERAAIDTVEAAILIQTRMIDFGYARIELARAINQLYYYQLGADSASTEKTFKNLDDLLKLEERCLSNFLKMQSLDVLKNPALVYYQNKSGLLEVEKKYRKEMVKPRLDFRYNLLGNNSVGNVTYSNNYKWGASFSMPLFLRNPANELKITKLELRNNEFERQGKQAEMETKLNAAKKILNLLAEQIKTAKQTLNYSKLLLDAEKIKFDNNESSLFLLNTRESKVLDSEIKLVELQAKFAAVYFDLVYLKGDMEYAFE